MSEVGQSEISKTPYAILHQIPHTHVETKYDIVDLYRLGVFNGSAYQLIQLQPNRYYPPHIHHRTDVLMMVVMGHGITIIEGVEKPYKTGDVFEIAKGLTQGFKTEDDLLFLVIETPPIIHNETGEIDLEYVHDRGIKYSV